MTIYLNVPFAQKDHAKTLGARWDPQARKWYIPEELHAQSANFSLWLTDSPPQAANQATIPSYQQSVQASSTPSDFFAAATQQPEPVLENAYPAQLEAKGKSLAALLQQVQQVLWQQFPGAQWVVAEVSNLSERRGHLYLELSETDENGRTIANAKGMIWQKQAIYIQQKFLQETQMPLAAGQKLLMLCEIKFHAQFGLSLEIQEIDSRFSLGELAQKVRQIRARLQQEGLYARNQQVPLADDFFNIAVIAPPNAAGLGDFQADAMLLQELNLCRFHYFYSSFQGAKVESEFLAAFTAVREQHLHDPFDALVIIRGGGATLDLQQLNQYSLAQQIATLSLPVLTGIGHERDNTILDEVAHSRFDTPSKVIHFIWQQILTQASTAQQNWQNIRQTSESILYGHEKQIENLWRSVEQSSQRQIHHWRQATVLPYQQLQQQAMHRLEQDKQMLTWLQQQIMQLSTQRLSEVKQDLIVLDKQITQHSLASLRMQQQQIKDWMALILNAGPNVQIARGFAVVANQKGATVTSKAQAVCENSLTLTFKDGSLLVHVATTDNEENYESR
ncbi:hypothetical protein THMIRHAS_13330 [Thiosulfatimonas sediminis]|uniref:Exodeoxyribonuclease VII large subunit n=1 Tax=Thiosulfatimonas sediminis TaxID=2675054 RepID=A0A6F8PVG2_9GAMM|nr:exodeoxyribonuclease VII large subunit [Thiosulfatimonas sediminis]BBP45960.1 hypothetical protein THMIRHAS_13330 [Thiosulfatimonas sediminis]